MKPNQPIAKLDFVPGSSRRARSVHSLALRIAEELGVQLTEEEEARRKAVAERLRELRGLHSQQWVANRIGVTSRAVQAWEAGGGIAPENIESLAALYKVDEDYILNGNDRRPSPDQVSEILNLLREQNQLLREVLGDRQLEALEAEVEAERRATSKRPGGRAASGS